MEQPTTDADHIPFEPRTCAYRFAREMKNFKHIPNPVKVLTTVPDSLTERFYALRTFIDEFIVDLAEQVAKQDNIHSAERKTALNERKIKSRLKFFVISDTNACLNLHSDPIIRDDSDQSQSPDR